MEASNASHLSPNQKELPVWRTATEKDGKTRRSEAQVRTSSPNVFISAGTEKSHSYNFRFF